LAVYQLFYGGWKHPNKVPPQAVRAIYAIDLAMPLLKPYLNYRDQLNARVPSGEEKLCFHGTRRRCRIGDPGQARELCEDSQCNVCLILRSSFAVNRSGTAPFRNFLRFGRGVYTSSISSKADDYNVSQTNSDFKAMFVARVLLGRSFPLYYTQTTLLQPPPGYDSVLGEVGKDLNYDEQIVYRDDAIRPAYLILYMP